MDSQDVQICLAASEDANGAMAPPIVQTSLFAKPSLEDLMTALAAEHRHPVYTRGVNPTVAAVEDKLAKLERGDSCKCFASGMAAISAIFLGLLKQGDHVLFVNQIYGPARQLAEHLRRFGIEHDLVVEPDLAAVAQAIRPTTKLLYFESPGTMTFRVLDIERLVDLARRHGAWTAIDNTWATPLFQKPITLGVDLVVHSATKYLGGHSDLVAGALVGSQDLIQQIFYNSLLLNGGILAPFDAWLLHRGLLTLPTRMAQHQGDGLRVARFLASHRAVRRVYHPWLEDDQRRICEGQLTGSSGLFSFELATEEFAQLTAFVDGLELFRIGVSWGGVESLVITPNRGDNGSALAAAGLAPGLVRLSIGLEGADALIADLDQALAAIPP